MTGTGIDYLWIVEGRRGTAVWVYPLAGRIPELTVRFGVTTDVLILDANSLAELQQTVLPQGESRLRLAATTPVLVLATLSAQATSAAPGTRLPATIRPSAK